MLRSAESYDSGHSDEARRLALSVRVLLHDTARQVSLLTLAGLKDAITYFDTVSEVDPRQHGSHLGLLALLMPFADGKALPPRVDARLDSLPNSPKPEMASFDEWWNGTAIRDDLGNTFTRRDIVLFLADQDGGAHVDVRVDPKYLRLASGEAGSWRPTGPDASEFTQGIELATARQVAHELLVTLARHHPGCFSDSLVSRHYANERLKRPIECAEITDPRVYLGKVDEIGRNDPCWCDSGRKYKKCHASPEALGRHDRGKQPWEQ
jgi:hypothetical protein